jgi:tetratricopeptide (TPR) repeat protein
VSRTLAAAIAILMGVVGRPAFASSESAALCDRASLQMYNLDREQALATFRQAAAADPEDPAAHRGVATALWLSITFRRGNMTVDDYLGRVTRTNAPPEPPPADTAAAFNDAIERSLAIARRLIQRAPDDPNGHYQLGATVGLRASYVATVDGKALGAFRAAREAYDEHEKVFALSPQRKDAGLIVGTYRYIVSTLAMPVRWMAYIAGFGGGKERGVSMVEDAANYQGENQTDARVALVLVYNREKRYDDALKQLAVLRQQFPRNRLFWLETGSTQLRAGRAAEAERVLDDGVSRFASDARPRMFGEEALWLYKRGAARAAIGRAREAEQDLRRAVSLEGRKWVHGRAQFEIGKLLLKSGNRDAARQAFQTAIPLAEADNDGANADEARRYLKP